MELYRLIYTSHRLPSCTDEELRQIMEKSAINNQKSEITGILLHSHNKFLQYMEGEKMLILNLFDSKIAKDPRHSKCIIRDFSSIEARAFPSWKMGYKDIDSQNVKFNSRISSKEMKVFNTLLSGKLEEGDAKAKIVRRFIELVKGQ